MRHGNDFVQLRANDGLFKLKADQFMNAVQFWKPDMAAIPGHVIFDDMTEKISKRTVDRTLAYLSECIELNKVRSTVVLSLFFIPTFHAPSVVYFTNYTIKST